MKQVFLGIGSNIGDKENNILNAIKYLSANKDIKIKKIASIIKTEAIPNNNQPQFLNTVIEIETSLTPEKLLEITRSIELKLKRFSKGDYGPRTIDIDILFYEDEIILTNDLTIPHPLLHERKFVLEPLCEIAPDLIHPILGISIKDIYEDYLKCGN